MQWLAIIVFSILACISYGVIHDQITARICIEYFTIGHPQVLFVPSNDPTLLGFVWGIIATWWVGVILGVPLAIVARIGSRPKRGVRSLIKPVALLLCCNAIFAAIAGVIGYIAASNGWIWLVGSIAEKVPRDRHVSFLTDLWAHNASYLGGFLGGIILMRRVWRSRERGLAVTHQQPRDEGEPV